MAVLLAESSSTLASSPEDIRLFLQSSVRIRLRVSQILRLDLCLYNPIVVRLYHDDAMPDLQGRSKDLQVLMHGQIKLQKRVRLIKTSLLIEFTADLTFAI